jgi:ABC-type branched-subunit amino acid transport system substrate-binding protein
MVKCRWTIDYRLSLVKPNCEETQAGRKKEDAMKKAFVTSVVLMFVLAGAAAVFAGGQQEGGEMEGGAEPIKVGHLTYHTGAFADVGPWFDGITEVTLEMINEDPPLGRPMVAVHQDIGTIGEAQAARKLVDSENVEVLLNPAHEYLSYRDWMLDVQESENGPLMPSVHGGGIRGDIGGETDEPIMRGAPMDSGQAVAAVIIALDEDKDQVVIAASEIEGSQLQLEAALHAADQVGLNVVDSFSFQPELASYRSEVNRISNADPDAVLVFSQAQDGGTIVKQAAEAGLSTLFIGTTEWLGEAFAETATQSAMDQHEAVWISGFAKADNPAYSFYEPYWTESEYADLQPADNSYNIQYWDVLTVTALAIEKAGSTNAQEWVPAVRAVAEPPGTKVYTYFDAIEAIRNGEEIDYDGTTGVFEYGPTGMVSGLYGIFEWQDGELVQVGSVEGDRVLENDLPYGE